MSAQGTQGEVDPLVGVGHEIPGANDGAQVMHLTQVEIAQIVSNAVSQALTHQMLTAAQQFQTLIKFDVPAFEGDSTASWLTWSQRVLYQARASGFENELTAAVGDGLSVGADVFDSSNVDPVRLRNAHSAWMILIHSCSGMALEIVQRSDAPNEAWRNLEFHYRAKGTREVLCLSHEINAKTMEPGSDPFKFMMEADRLVADLRRLGEKSVTELRNCVIIVSGLSADFEMEYRFLENNPAGLNRAEIERVVGNQYNRLLRQQQDSKALSASKGTVTANREEGKNSRLHHKFDGKCFKCGKKGHRAVDCRSAKKKSEKSGATDDRKEGGGSGRCYICGSEEHLAHRHCGLRKSLEHRTRDCEERGAEKGAMLAKLTVPVVPEVREVTATVGAARSVRKEEWESDSGATFHMSHTRTGMSAYKKASPGTNVEIADGNILPVGGSGRIEVDLDQPRRTTKMVKMDDVACVPGLSRNLLSTVKAAEQWGKPLIYYRNKAVLRFPGEESLVFKFCPRRGLFSATGARRIPRQEAALEANLTENGLVIIASGATLRASASRDIMEVHRMFAHPSEDITRKTAVMMGIETTGQWGACETCFQAKAKRHAVPKKTDERASVRTRKIVERQAVQWVDGPKKAGGEGTGSDDRGMKSAVDGTIVKRGTPQLNVQGLGQEQHLTMHDHETQEAFGTGSDDRGMKSAGDGTIIERGTPQLNVQELGQEQQLTLHEHETQEAFGTGSDDRGMKSAGDGTFVERGTPQFDVQELGHFQNTKGRRRRRSRNSRRRPRRRYRNLRRRRRRRFRKTSESSSMRRGKRNLHWGRQIWRDRPYPRCVSSPSTAISRPYCHHVQGVEDPTPVWREKRCIVSCRRSRPKRKTAWMMRWRATTGARWLCRRR